MERRSFLKGLAGLVGGIALEKAIPFNRVWSFPSQIIIPKTLNIRVVRAFDIARGGMLWRVDTLFGHPLIVPKAVEYAHSVMIPQCRDPQSALRATLEKFRLQVSPDVIAQLVPDARQWNQKTLLLGE